MSRTTSQDKCRLNYHFLSQSPRAKLSLLNRIGRQTVYVNGVKLLIKKFRCAFIATYKMQNQMKAAESVRVKF